MTARRTISRRGFLVGLAGLALGLPACSQNGNFTVLGYTTKPNYCTDFHTIHVPIFKNLTAQQGLEFDLTREVIRQIHLKTPYRVVSSWKDADTELTGTITLANKSILNRNQLNEIREAETSLVVELVWRDLKTGEILSKPKKEGEAPVNTQIPGIPAITGHPDDFSMFTSPPTPPGKAPKVSAVVLAHSQANFIPELGESLTTAQQKNVQRLATQIVSLMEVPW